MNGADTETASRPLAFSTEHVGPGDARRCSASQVYSPEPSQARRSNRTAVSAKQVGVAWERRLDDRVDTHLSR